MLSELELEARVKRLQERWPQRNPFATEDPVWREIFSASAMAFLHACCVADLKFPEWKKGTSFANYHSGLEGQWATNKSAMDAGVRAGAVVWICPAMIARWADDFLLGSRTPAKRLRNSGSAQGQDELALKPKGPK